LKSIRQYNAAVLQEQLLLDNTILLNQVHKCISIAIRRLFFNLKINHKNSNKNKSGMLSQDDIQELNVWTAGWRGDHSDLDVYLKKASTYVPIPQKYRFSITRVAGGICLGCDKKRCVICNGCPIDVFQQDLDTHHCQRCICYNEREQSKEPLNETGIALGELVRKRQGSGFKKEGNK
jgi:hypothetical protein